MDCPNPVCKDGKTQWQGGDEDPCKLCKGKGTFKCADCRGEKKGNCTICGGIGKRVAPCGTCTGKGRLACPLCTIDPARACCSTCDGGGRVECGRCAGATSRQTRPCLLCVGQGQRACPHCHGVGEASCGKCGGSGKVRMAIKPRIPIPGAQPEKGGGVKSCDECKGRGIHRCVRCKKGRVDCAACDGGKVAEVCAPCLHARQLPCEECLSGGHSRWETLGRFLLQEGHKQRAALFLRRALGEAQAMEGPRRPEARLVQLVELAQELRRIDRQHVQPRMPGLADQEWFLPLDARQRYWSWELPVGNVLTPWRDDEWLERYRTAVCARIAKALAECGTGDGR